ncbi:hypothetical protein NUW58_g2980 [Xylaria curta]|uniref:Uncharacterized protein n=1 Tax=Xylaria curta TaxID=42375 RepID=A0ACC1PE04_9PEZI|nr:hypothetical protein NUW58_g2980 [Xylaria curta]
MFRRKWSALPADPVFPSDLKKLGCVIPTLFVPFYAACSLMSFGATSNQDARPTRYFINKDDEIRSIENEDNYFNYFISRNSRVCDRQRFAMNPSTSKIPGTSNAQPRSHPERNPQAARRLGLNKVFLPVGTSEPSQPSVIATIPGASAEVVIVSAHYDSVGSTTSGRAPGADDNASGVVVVLEALRVLAEAKYAPSNTLEFHFYSGEEGGLLGSRDVFNSYVRSGVDVLAVMNQDMTGYSPNNVIAVFSDYGDAGLIAFIRKLVPVYTSLPVSTDRASAYSAGYPAAYVCDENIRDSSPYIHSAQDTVSTVSFPHVLQHARLTVGFLVEASYF